jgi:hypothetical protein
MLAATGNLLVFLGSPFLAVERTFRLANEVKFLFTLRDKGPVRIVGADGRIDLEPGRQLDEELDVLVAVEVARELLFNLGFIHDGVEERFVTVLNLIEIVQIPNDAVLGPAQRRSIARGEQPRLAARSTFWRRDESGSKRRAGLL